MLAYVFGRQLAAIDDPLLFVLSLGIYIPAVAILARPQFGAYLLVLSLMIFSASPFFQAQPVVVGPLILPTPLMGVTLFTIGVGAARLLLTRRFQRLPWEPSWMGLVLIILVVQVAFALIGYGSDSTEVRRLTSTLEGLSAFLVVILVLHRPGQLRLLLRCLAVGYLVYACANSLPSWFFSRSGYRELEDSSYLVSAATTAAAMVNLFLPVGLGMVIGDPSRNWRRITLASLVSCVLFSMLTTTRGGFLGIGFSLLVWVILGRRYVARRLFVGIGSTVLMMLLVNSTYNYYVSSPSLSGDVSIFEFMYHSTMDQLSDPEPRGRRRIYTTAWQNIRLYPWTGIGAGRLPSHSLFLGAGLDGGILMMGLWLSLFTVFSIRSYRLWRAFRYHPNWGPVVLGLFISMAYAFIQNCLDPMLYAVGYGLVFWLLRGVESTLNAQKSQVNFPVKLQLQESRKLLSRAFRDRIPGGLL
ncbi:O-antigen ligase family protein [Acidobacteria bacterium AH-259-A15]|nr:O-antigen ligase family protein [Acidobacteria bacterium AH-259-A15]